MTRLRRGGAQIPWVWVDPISSSSLSNVLAVTGKLFVGVHGQSNASGSSGHPALTSGSNPYGNEQTNEQTNAARSSITQLIEFPSDPGGQERCSSGLLNWLSVREPNRRSLTTNAAVGATAFSGLMSGTAPWTNLITGMRTCESASVGQGSGSLSRGVLAWVHGENDELNGVSSSQYSDYLIQLQSDFQRDFRLIATASNANVPVVYTQICNWSKNAGAPRYRSEVAQAQYQAHLSSSNLVLAGPLYHLPFVSGGNDLHHTNKGHRRLGEYLARVVQRVAVTGSAWTPLRPASIVASASTITLTLEGGDELNSCSIDTTTVAYRPFNGFEIVDGTATAPQITFVSQSGGNVFTIGATSTLHAASLLSYGLRSSKNSVNGTSGIGLNAGGNIRDNDPTPSAQAGEDPLRNWLVGFRRGFDTFTAGAEPTGSFAANTLSLRGGSTTSGQGLTVGRLPGFDGSTTISHLLVSMWHRRDTSWHPANEVLISQNATGQRVFDVRSAGNGAIGVTISTSLSDSSTVFNTSGSTFAGNTWYNIAWYLSGSGVGNLERLSVYSNATWVSGTYTGSMPASLASGSTIDAEIWSIGGSGMASNCNACHVAMWVGVAIPSASRDAVMAEIYNGGTPPDLNTVSIGRPTHWWPLNGTYANTGSSLPLAHAFPVRSGTFTAVVP